MADLETLKAAETATIIWPTAALGNTPMWLFQHYEFGRPASKSIARGDQITEWLQEVNEAGYVIGLSWELRGEDAPDGWPLSRWQNPGTGWPTDTYIDTVAESLAVRGSHVANWWREGDHDITLLLDEETSARAGCESVRVGWYIDKAFNALTGEWRRPGGCCDWQHPGGCCGWNWVPYSDRSKTPRGDFVQQLPVPALADPGAVAAAVKHALALDGGDR